MTFACEPAADGERTSNPLHEAHHAADRPGAVNCLPRKACPAKMTNQPPGIQSITASARVSSVTGMARFRISAVFRLMTNSNLVGACTGRSAGFSPLRMRST